jgi:hypothetical protein
LRWRALKVRYASVLECRQGQVRSASSLRGCAPPSISGDTIEWSSRALRASGTWKALAAPLEATMLASEAGEIRWKCVQPSSAASVTTGDAAWRGLGYAEHLRMTLAPWQLPIDELRWGRFLSQTEALVWIDLRGAARIRMAFHNGIAVDAERISDDAIVLESGTQVAFDDRRVLRQGPLGRTVLAAIPKLARLAPGRILGLDETKWLSRATLSRPGAPASHGWAIHEVVRWPR